MGPDAFGVPVMPLARPGSDFTISMRVQWDGTDRGVLHALVDSYAAIGVHSGLACGAARDLPSAFAAMAQGASSSHPARAENLVPTIVFHGDEDHTVNKINGDQVIAQSRMSRLPVRVTEGRSPGGMSFTRTSHQDVDGKSVLERWVLHDAGHAWSGGSAAGSYTDPRGPDASREMMGFFLQHSRRP